MVSSSGVARRHFHVHIEQAQGVGGKEIRVELGEPCAGGKDRDGRPMSR